MDNDPYCIALFFLLTFFLIRFCCISHSLYSIYCVLYRMVHLRKCSLLVVWLWPKRRVKWLIDVMCTLLSNGLCTVWMFEHLASFAKVCSVLRYNGRTSMKIFLAGGKENFQGGRNGKKCVQSKQNLLFLCWNCQILANFNSFEIILMEQQNFLWCKSPHGPLW